MKLHAIAVELIANSSLIDFEDALKWGQWCRHLCNCADCGDEELLLQLKKQLDDKRKAVAAAI